MEAFKDEFFNYVQIYSDSDDKRQFERQIIQDFNFHEDVMLMLTELQHNWKKGKKALTVILGHLKGLGELLKESVLTKVEFEEQKQLVLIDLTTIK